VLKLANTSRAEPREKHASHCAYDMACLKSQGMGSRGSNSLTQVLVLLVADALLSMANIDIFFLLFPFPLGRVLLNARVRWGRVTW
jgi:hypothetical protein